MAAGSARDKPHALVVVRQRLAPDLVIPSPTALIATVRPSGPPPQPRTLADLLAEVIGRGSSDRTRLAYRGDLEDFLSWLLGTPISLPLDPKALRSDPILTEVLDAAVLPRLVAVSERDIAAYLDHLARERPARRGGAVGLAPTSRNRRLTPLRLLFTRLQRHQLIALNPLDDIRAARTGTHSAAIWLTRQQARTLEEACAGDSLRDLRDRALIVLMLATGLRASEVLGLTVADLASVEGHRVAWVTGKGGARERVKLAPKAERAIRGWLDAAGIAEGPLFRRLYRLKAAPGDATGVTIPYRAHTTALAYTGLKFLLQERFTEAGLSPLLTPHGLRHSFVTLALRGGAALTRVQAAARHKSPQTTMRYAHEQDELDDNAVDYVRW